jgi:hypothetical protein
MTMMKATDSQTSSVGIKETMGTRSGRITGGDHALYPLVSRALGLVQSFDPAGPENQPPPVGRRSWLPFLGAYRAPCLAPETEIRMVFQYFVGNLVLGINLPGGG